MWGTTGCLAVLVLASGVNAKLWNIQDHGAVANNFTYDTAVHNTIVVNTTLAALQPGDTLFVPNTTFAVGGGIANTNPLQNIVFQIDGTLRFDNDPKRWPRKPGGQVLECIMLTGLNNVTFTSSGTGTLDGRGEPWWGYINYALHGENRPRLMHLDDVVNVEVEHLLLKQSPYWTFYASDVNGLHIHHSDISVHRSNATTHDLYNMGAFNTDGFDVAGANVYIHDVNVWNDDDCVCVKGTDSQGKNAQCSENWLVERVNASGVGLTIGSIGPSDHHTCVRNITFRDCDMHNTFKGLYVKSRPGGPGQTAEITDVVYENIRINGTTQWGIWVGPQQAAYGGACNLFWPWLPKDLAPCPVPSGVTFSNLMFRNISISNSVFSPGVILGNTTNPMRNITFDNVVAVDHVGMTPWGSAGYKCDGVVNSTATGSTFPVPPCFTHK